MPPLRLLIFGCCLVLGLSSAWADIAVEAAPEPAIDLGGIPARSLDPGLHCIDQTARTVRRIGEAHAAIVDSVRLPASAHTEAQADVHAEIDVAAGPRRDDREPGGLVASMMQPMREFQAQVRKESGRRRQEGRSWGLHARTRFRGSVSGHGQLSLSSPELAGLPPCDEQDPRAR